MLMLEPVHHMMFTGIRIDQKKKKENQESSIEEWKHEQELLDKLTGYVNFNAEGKKIVPEYLYGELKLGKKTKRGKITTNEAAIRTIMAECKGKINNLKTLAAKEQYIRGYLTCLQILRVRGVRKRISSYLGLQIKKGVLVGSKSLEDDDGRIRGTISVGGTETGRFSHSKTIWGTGVNLATIPRKLRSMFIADDGCELAELDLNRGESWIYAHLSQDPELLRIHIDGLDFHAETAATISEAFGTNLSVEWIIEHKDEEAYKIRFIGKKVNHASSYRMKAFKGAESVNQEADETGIVVSVSEFNTARKLWLKRYSYVPDLWWPSIERELDRTRTMITPYGRIHQFHDRWGEDLFKSATAYVPQSTSVDYLNRGFLNVYHQFVKPKAWDLKILAQTHDSLLVQYKEDCRDECLNEVAHAMSSTLVINDREFSIPIEVQYGQSWRDTKSFKLTT